MTAKDLRPRLRIGYVTPHPLNDTLQYEIHLMAPSGIMLMTAGLEISDYSAEAVEDQLDVLHRRIRSLMRRGAQRIVIAGVPVAIALGRKRMQQLLVEIATRTGVPADTSLEAIITAAKHLGARRITAATRWHNAVNERLSAYLIDAGLEPVGIASSGRTMEENAGLDDETGMKLASDLGREALSLAPSAEALMMPGSRWITLAAVRELEGEFGIPVLTGHSAGLWAALHAAGIREAAPGNGKLLASLAEVD